MIFEWSDPLSERLSGIEMNGIESPQVIGVVKDFNFRSLHQPVEPMAMFVGAVNNLLVRIQPNDVPATMATLEATWNEFCQWHTLFL